MAAKILQFPDKFQFTGDTGPEGPEGIEFSILGFFEMLRQEGLFLVVSDGEADFTPPEGMLA